MSVLNQMLQQMQVLQKQAEVYKQQEKIKEEYFNQMIQGVPEEHKQKMINAKNDVERIINLAKRGDGSHIQAIKEIQEKYASIGNK